MRKIIVLLLGLFLVPVSSVLAQNCGENRQFLVPAGVAPGEFAASIGTTFEELQKLNPGLTDRNLRAGAPICVPIKSEAYWAALSKASKEWVVQRKIVVDELAVANESIKQLNIQLGHKGYMDDAIKAAAIVFFVLFVIAEGRRRALIGRLDRHKGRIDNRQRWYEKLLLGVASRR